MFHAFGGEQDWEDSATPNAQDAGEGVGREESPDRDAMYAELRSAFDGSSSDEEDDAAASQDDDAVPQDDDEDWLGAAPQNNDAAPQDDDEDWLGATEPDENTPTEAGRAPARRPDNLMLGQPGKRSADELEPEDEPEDDLEPQVSPRTRKRLRMERAQGYPYEQRRPLVGGGGDSRDAFGYIFRQGPQTGYRSNRAPRPGALQRRVGDTSSVFPDLPRRPSPLGQDAHVDGLWNGRVSVPLPPQEEVVQEYGLPSPIPSMPQDSAVSRDDDRNSTPPPRPSTPTPGEDDDENTPASAPTPRRPRTPLARVPSFRPPGDDLEAVDSRFQQGSGSDAVNSENAQENTQLGTTSQNTEPDTTPQSTELVTTSQNTEPDTTTQSTELVTTPRIIDVVARPPRRPRGPLRRVENIERTNRQQEEYEEDARIILEMVREAEEEQRRQNPSGGGFVVDGEAYDGLAIEDADRGQQESDAPAPDAAADSDSSSDSDTSDDGDAAADKDTGTDKDAGPDDDAPAGSSAPAEDDASAEDDAPGDNNAPTDNNDSSGNNGSTGNDAASDDDAAPSSTTSPSSAINASTAPSSTSGNDTTPPRPKRPSSLGRHPSSKESGREVGRLSAPRPRDDELARLRLSNAKLVLNIQDCQRRYERRKEAADREYRELVTEANDLQRDYNELYYDTYGLLEAHRELKGELLATKQRAEYDAQQLADARDKEDAERLAYITILIREAEIMKDWADSLDETVEPLRLANETLKEKVKAAKQLNAALRTQVDNDGTTISELQAQVQEAAARGLEMAALYRKVKATASTPVQPTAAPQSSSSSDSAPSSSYYSAPSTPPRTPTTTPFSLPPVGETREEREARWLNLGAVNATRDAQRNARKAEEEQFDADRELRLQAFKAATGSVYVEVEADVRRANLMRIVDEHRNARRAAAGRVVRQSRSA